VTAGRTRSPLTPALREIQQPVAAKLGDVAAELRRIVTADIPLIEEAGDHLLQMRGKMLRPTLLLLASESNGTPDARAIPLAAAVELIHLATLVHDDAVDHSVLRRGMPTINSLFSHQVSVLMGDFLYARALATLVQGSEFEALRILTAASVEMSVGEIRQLAAFDALRFSEEDYDTLIRAKTAALFAGALEVGSLCGAERHRAALALFGMRLGMAFQIADDLLDYTEDAAITGKPMGLDLREHKVTLPLIHVLRSAGAAERARVDALFATVEPTDEQIADVISIVAEHGGLEYARHRGEQLAQDAEEALATLPDTPARSALLDIIAYVMDRRS
jgi:octaprenyl-diphosphate synthase